MAVLLRKLEDVLADHQRPTDERVPAVVWLSIPGFELVDDIAPTIVRIAELDKWRTFPLEEDEVVFDPALPDELLAEGELAHKYFKRAATESDFSILTGLCPVLLTPQYDRLGDSNRTGVKVTVMNRQRHLFRLAQAGEESKFLIVPVRLAELRV